MSDPVAWYVRHAADEPPLLFTDEKQANDAAFTSGIGARPLYRRQVSSQQNLTAAERGAVDRARIAFRDMDHNSMTMQQLEDYEALCGLLARLGGCTPQLDCGANRKFVASERCRDTGGQPFKSAPITITDAGKLNHPANPDSSILTDEEREAVQRAADALSGVDDWSPDESEKDDLAVAALRALLARLSP